MYFLKAVEKKRYDTFVANHSEKSHFMQSVAWGELNALERSMTPHYVGMEDKDKNLVAAALLLERKPFFAPPYFYSPRGFVVDFFNDSLLKEFSQAVGVYCREEGAMFLKIDPDIERREIDAAGTQVIDGADNSELIERLNNLGFTHLGFNSGFERRQPRFTFRVDLSPDREKILSRIEGNVIKNVRKGESNYEAEIYKGEADDVDEFYGLIKETSERDDFYAYSKRYYRSFYDILAKYGMVDLYLGKIYIERTAESLKKQLEILRQRKKSYTKERRIKQAEDTERRLLAELTRFEGYIKSYGKQRITSAHMVVRYGKHAWAVHAGSADDIKESFLNNRVYLHKILDQKEAGAEWVDLFGTVGNPINSPLRSLHDFKKQFGGRYIEFIGEFDMIFKPLWYNIYANLLPRYRALLFNFREWMRKREKHRGRF